MEDEEQVLMVAPYWPTQTWFSDLMLLTSAPPWQIPLRKDLYFIINLVVCDVLFSTTTLPKIISRYWFQDETILFLGCFVQMFFVHYLGGVCLYVLAVMAIDRYAAICYPLQYHGIMTNGNVLILILNSWVLKNTIIHCYCDHVSITTLACTNRALYSVPALIYALVVLMGSFAIIVFSYTRGKMKTFSTCSPQLIIIALYFLPRCFIYLFGNIGIKFSTDLRLVIDMMYTLLPYMINPLIYCLRTEEVKTVLRSLLQNKQIGIP
ncbi:hypothetical protein ABG768_007728 [Culter alburnus]|uniref:G-protein coupled receptors family 1 profile domain-containing protein n=1 Tax=Culter alburnus TaxID=194366 RepID=A0AAW1ZNB7_CULAL